MVQKQSTTLKEEMDYWVKDFEKKIRRTSEIDIHVVENKQNIDYNYELIQGLQKENEKLRKEINELKHVSLIALKSRPLKNLD